jgi:hypothetical protein
MTDEPLKLYNSILTATGDSIFSVYDGGVSGAQTSVKRARRFGHSTNSLYRILFFIYGGL